jgi:hypothetical protein
LPGFPIAAPAEEGRLEKLVQVLDDVVDETLRARAAPEAGRSPV